MDQLFRKDGSCYDPVRETGAPTFFLDTAGSSKRQNRERLRGRGGGGGQWSEAHVRYSFVCETWEDII